MAQAQATAQKDKSNAEAQAELDRATGLKAAVAANPSGSAGDTRNSRCKLCMVFAELRGTPLTPLLAYAQLKA